MRRPAVIRSRSIRGHALRNETRAHKWILSKLRQQMGEIEASLAETRRGLGDIRGTLADIEAELTARGL